VRAGRSLKIGLAVVAGLSLGWVTARAQLARHRSDLFHLRPVRRLAALSYLGGHPDPANLRVLRDYLAWENHPVLRRKATQIIRRFEATIG
jgi:hypothetical protein